jgi:phosphoribosylformylglycinamidine synthase
VKHAGNVVGQLDMAFLHDGCPTMQISALWTPPNLEPPKALRKGNRNRALAAVLSALNVCSKEHKSRIYDGEVKGLSVVKPFVGVASDIPSDATVLRADYATNDGVVLAEGINPFYSDLDTYHMMASVFDEGVRRCISVGSKLGDIAGLDNFCWPDPVASEKSPDGSYKMAQLVRANKALYDVAVAYGVPLISGKDSMKNDSVRGGRKISIPPTVLFSTIARMRDVRQAVTMEFKRAGDLIYVIGQTRDELGASEFHRWLAEQQGDPRRVGGNVPKVDTAQALAIYRVMGNRRAGLLRSCHTPTVGGLVAALALAAAGGRLGTDVDLARVPQDEKLADDALLFSESNSRFVVSCPPESAGELETMFAGLPCARVGTVTSEPVLKIRRGDTELVDAQIGEIVKAFKKTLDGI